MTTLPYTIESHNAVVLRLIESRLPMLKELRDAHQRSVDSLNAVIANEEAFVERKKVEV